MGVLRWTSRSGTLQVYSFGKFNRPTECGKFMTCTCVVWSSKSSHPVRPRIKCTTPNTLVPHRADRCCRLSRGAQGGRRYSPKSNQGRGPSGCTDRTAFRRYVSGTSRNVPGRIDQQIYLAVRAPASRPCVTAVGINASRNCDSGRCRGVVR